MQQRKMTQYTRRSFLALLFLTVFSVSSAVAHSSLQVQWKDEYLSVRTEKVVLSQLLQEIARQTGMEIHTSDNLEEYISVSFARLSLHEGLEKLFTNYVVIWKGSPQNGQRPALAFVSGLKDLSYLPGFSEQTAETKEPVTPTVDEPQPQEERLEALHASAAQSDEQALQEALFDSDPTAQTTAVALLIEQNPQSVIAALVEAATSAQSERRLQALHLLSQTDQADEETVLSTLSYALTDKDMTVKAYAIQALAAHKGTEAQEYLRQAFHDLNPNVRMLVIQSVVGQDQGRPLLQEALADQDEAVRSLATALLAGGTADY